MLILNQLRNKVVNVDAVESIEVDYNTGNSYTIVKAVVEHPWDNEEFPTKKITIALGEYSTSVKAEEVIKWIYTANLAESRGFKMPKDGEVDVGF
ncbi:MAG: hypothetical protein IIY57_01745 [Erysipelotrichaceae bacterium]|nr:hypothetical protein [Erysipelotrichaceae bacterium]